MTRTSLTSGRASSGSSGPAPVSSASTSRRSAANTASSTMPSASARTASSSSPGAETSRCRTRSTSSVMRALRNESRAFRGVHAASPSRTPAATRAADRGVIDRSSGGSTPSNGAPSRATASSIGSPPRRSTTPTGPSGSEASTARAAASSRSCATATTTCSAHRDSAASRTGPGERGRSSTTRRGCAAASITCSAASADGGADVGGQHRHRSPARQPAGEQRRIEMAAVDPQSRPPRTRHRFDAEQHVDAAAHRIEIDEHARRGGRSQRRRRTSTRLPRRCHRRRRRLSPRLRPTWPKARAFQPVRIGSKAALWTTRAPVDGGLDSAHPYHQTRGLPHRSVLRSRQDDHRQVERAGVRQTLLPGRIDQPAGRPAQRVRAVRLRARRRRRGSDRAHARLPDRHVPGLGRRPGARHRVRDAARDHRPDRLRRGGRADRHAQGGRTRRGDRQLVR